MALCFVVISQYTQLPFDTADILAEFGVSLKNIPLELPRQLPIDAGPLKIELQENLALVDPSSEIARRETLIFLVLRKVCKFIQAPILLDVTMGAPVAAP